MNNPNPFVPKGSLLEQQSQRRFQLKIAVGCVLTVSVLGLVVMLIQGCKRETPNENPAPEFPTNTPSFTGTNSPMVDTNPIVMPAMPTNTPPGFVIPPVAPAMPETPGSTYEVVKGDTLTTIAKAHHVSLKDLQAANPGVDSKHLKLKQKITIPAAKAVEAAPAAAAVAGAVATDAGGELYTIKSGDTLDKIAKAHHTTAKAIQAANNLTTTKIIVGKKLKLPAVAPVAPVVEPAPLVVPMIPAPAPAPAK